MQKNQFKPKQKKKNIETGIIMGQNTNVFSQLSATFLQHKSSTNEQQQAFLKNTQVVEYHDQNINRLISLLRKKAEVTKIKAALELHEQINKMSSDQVQEFISTFAQLYLEIAVNQPSKQITEEFAAVFNDLIAREKKTVISEISTLYPPLLLTHKLPKLASLLFTGNEEQLGSKVLLLLLKKELRKKFIVMTKIIMDCEAKEKILQPQYQRNCQALTKVIKQFIRLFQKNPKSQQLQADFSSFIKEICESFGETCIDEYFKTGGKAKASIIEFYTTLVAISSRRPHWQLEWQSYSKTIGSTFLDKDPLVQQSLWKGSVHVWIQSLLLLQSKEVNQKQANPLLNIYLPKSDEKLLMALKVGGFGLYKQLPRLCEIFPHTTFLTNDTHKQIINKLGFCRKLLTGLLGQQDQNQARMECYAGLADLLIKRARGITLPDDEKKSKQIKSLIVKFQREVLQNLQERYYNEPPTSKNQFSYYIPSHFTALINNLQPCFDFKFNPQHTYSLYQGLSLNPQNQNLIDTIFEHSKQSQAYTLRYLQVFPAKKVEIDMSQANSEAETAAKIYLLTSALPALNEQWLHEDWDIRKKVIAYDPRISQRDLDADDEEEDPNSHTLYFRPTQRKLPSLYDKPQLDQIRFNFFQKCLLEAQSSHLIKYLIPFMSDILIPRNAAVIDRLLVLFVERSHKANEGKWIVGAHQVLVIRVLTQLISEAIIRLRSLKEFNKEHSQEFLLGFCQFVRLLLQYKMQTQTEDLLRKAQSLLVVEEVQPFLFTSCQKTITKAVQILISGGIDGAQKIRKNRIKKCLELINKLLWFCIPRNNENQLVKMTLDFVRQENNWKNALDRSEAWQVAFTFIHSLRNQALNRIVEELLANHQLYVRQLTLLLSVDALLPLQALPDAKKIYTNLKHTIHKSILSLDQAKIAQVLGSLMQAIFKGGEIVLAEGLKSLITFLLLSNEQDNTSILNSFRKGLVLSPFDNFVKPLKNINHILLYISVVSAIPLRRIQQSQKICIQLTELLLKAQGIQLLMVISTIGLFWNKGVGSAEAINNDNQLLKSTLNRCLQALNHPSATGSTQKVNFGIYTLFNLVNVCVGLAGKQILTAHYKRIQELFWTKIQKGSDLQAFAQSVKMKYASRAVMTAEPHNLSRMITQLPELILQELVFYKEIVLSLDADEEQPQYHENITLLFTEAAEFLLRASAYVTNQRIPQEQTLLELVRCPFPALKKAAFLLLRAIYQGKFVKAQPPNAFINALKMQLKGELINTQLFNNSASYFYLWQLLILRRQATDQDLASEQSMALSLQDLIQSEGLNQIFIRNCFWILEDQLDYLKNQNDYLITPEELLDQDPQTELLQQGEIQQKLFKLTVRTFFIFVSNFPLFLRDFMDRLKKYKNVCQRLLRNVISETIFREEVIRIELMQQKWKAGGNFQIFVTPKNKEIYAEYVHDVIRIGLRLVMRGTYPLTPIAIEFGQGLKMDEGSRWGLMLQSQLHNRNNTVINGILLWKQNIDKKLSGVEQCAICFDIVNPTGQLPKKGCKTCRKKFHGNCIMKWFTKSNKSECPLCKSQFL